MNQRYEILNQLGEGGEGTVWKAWDTRLQRHVAVKMLLPPSKREVPEAGDIFAEASALSALQHPNVVSVYDVETDEETGPYVVMEFLNGENLEQTVRRGGLTPQDFISICEQSLEGLVAAHKLGMQHRDIKPSNIMLTWLPDQRFIAKLLDFGLAKFTARPSQQTVMGNNKIMGSIYFMAPEQFSRRPLDYRSDLYCLGCVLYYSLTTRYPFNGDTSAAVMRSHLDHSVAPLRDIRPDVPPLLCDWVMWLMRRQPEHRPRDAGQALEVFRGIMNGEVDELPETVTGLRTTNSVMPTRAVTGISRLSGAVPKRNAPAGKTPAKSGKWPWIAAGGALVVAGGLVAMMSMKGTSENPAQGSNAGVKPVFTPAVPDAPVVAPVKRQMSHQIPDAPPIKSHLTLWMDAAAGTFRSDNISESHHDDEIGTWVDLSSFTNTGGMEFHTEKNSNSPYSRLYRDQYGFVGEQRSVRFKGEQAPTAIAAKGSPGLLDGNLNGTQFTVFVVMRATQLPDDAAGRRVISAKCGEENKAWDIMVNREQVEAGIRKPDGKPSKSILILPDVDDQFFCVTFVRDGANDSASASVSNSKGVVVQGPSIKAAHDHGPLMQLTFGALSDPGSREKPDYFEGDISMVLIYNSTLTDAEQAATLKYVNKRFFGIQ